MCASHRKETVRSGTGLDERRWCSECWGAGAPPGVAWGGGGGRGGLGPGSGRFGPVAEVRAGVQATDRGEDEVVVTWGKSLRLHRECFCSGRNMTWAVKSNRVD